MKNNSVCFLLRLPNSQNASVVSGGGFFSWGTKFRYSGRTEREILTESLNALREQQLANSTSPSKRKASSVPATPSSPQGDLAQIRKLLRNSYISGYQYQYLNYHSGYSSLPRSAMSEPLGNCSSDHIGNIYNPDNAMQLLEPVSEEARRASSNLLDNANNPELSDYYFRDSFEHSSTESGLTNTYVDTQRLHHQLQQHQLQQTKHHQYGSRKEQSLPSGALHNRMLLASGAASSAPDSYISQTSISNSAVIRQNAANSAKSVRKFSLLHAFIPSFLFVVTTMVISAIFILESESETLAQVRNLPEMIILKYHYYQPLKDYIAKYFGAKS